MSIILVLLDYCRSDHIRNVHVVAVADIMHHRLHSQANKINLILFTRKKFITYQYHLNTATQ